MERITKKRFWVITGIISALGLALRFLGFPFESVDYQECLSAWSAQLKEIGTIRALSEYPGDYNYPYVTILWLLTFLPVPSLYSIKLVSVLFDFLEAGLLASAAMYAADAADATDAVAGGKRYGAGLLAYGLVFCNPLAVMNSSYLAQCESIWTALCVLSFYLLIVREKAGPGFFAFGMALAFKLQSVFILPILLIAWFYKKKFTILHMLWVPVAVELLCIPAIIGGCGWDSAISQYLHLLGEYPFLFYYYPNIWTFFREAPYYVFGTTAVMFAFVVLLLFAVLLVKSGRRLVIGDFIQYAAWTAMTCTMLLPCMHERYNYVAEMLLPVSAVYEKKLRLPALILILTSAQCIGQQFLGWTPFSYYALAASNILVYFYFSAHVFSGLYREYRENMGAVVC